MSPYRTAATVEPEPIEPEPIEPETVEPETVEKNSWWRCRPWSPRDLFPPIFSAVLCVTWLTVLALLLMNCIPGCVVPPPPPEAPVDIVIPPLEEEAGVVREELKGERALDAGGSIMGGESTHPPEAQSNGKKP
jgi:hypothetical protein